MMEAEPFAQPKNPFPSNLLLLLPLLLLFTLDVLTFPSFPYSSVYLYAVPETAGPSRLMGLYPTLLLSNWVLNPSTGTHLSHKLCYSGMFQECISKRREGHFKMVKAYFPPPSCAPC